MQKVNIGVVGLGWVAQVVHLPILTRLPEVNLVAICDKDKSRARLVGDKLGIRKVYTDVRAMVETEDINAVIVCTSTDTHKEIALIALEAGKDVLVEKPIAPRYVDAVEMAEAAKLSRRKLMVGMNLRFRPDSMILKSFLDGKELGKIFLTKIGWFRKKRSESDWAKRNLKAGGGVFFDLGIVMLDMAFWLVDYPSVRRVQAVHFHHRTKSVEDTSLVSLTLNSGAVIQIEASWSISVHDDVFYGHVFGTDGTASLSPLRINKELHGNLVNLAPAKMESPHTMFKRSYENELRHFVGAVMGVHPVISTAEEAVQRMRIVDAVYKSAKKGREVLLS
ncbi:MAG: Gfo/Idh/MocA family oxidoreductase [Ignavibacteria bacterium]|nr:Gfo/Idh/MocA family oxidoreductase [Ignavibacteria bacterium]